MGDANYELLSAQKNRGRFFLLATASKLALRLTQPPVRWLQGSFPLK